MTFEDCQRRYDRQEPPEYWREEMIRKHEGGMNNCRTCKHWKGNREAVPQWNAFGECPVLSDPGRNQGGVGQPLYLFEWTIKNSYDGEESVTAETHPEFGCALWEAE